MATILQFLVFFIMLIGGILLLGVAFNAPIMPGPGLRRLHRGVLLGLHHPDHDRQSRHALTTTGIRSLV